MNGLPCRDRGDFEGAATAVGAGDQAGEDGAREYFAIIVQDSDMSFHAAFPDLPGCIAEAATFDGARKAAGKALARHLAARKSAGVAIPKPSTLAAVVGGEDEHCGAAILVRENAGRSPPDDEGLSLAFERIDDSARAAHALALANNAVLAEIVRALADAARNRHDYLADMFARISAQAERSPIEGPPHGLSASFREELSKFFAHVARGSTP